MFKRNQFYTALVATSAVIISSAAVAQETVTGDATVTVANAFDIQQDVAIDFGTLRIFNDVDTTSTGEAIITIPGNTNPMTLAAAAPTEADGNIITQGAPGEFSITGAAPFTPLNIGFPVADSVTMTNTAAPPSTPAFVVNFSEATTFVVGGANDGILYNDTTPNLTTDGTGAVGFRLGGVLNTLATTDEVYADGAYTGSFALTVEY